MCTGFMFKFLLWVSSVEEAFLAADEDPAVRKRVCPFVVSMKTRFSGRCDDSDGDAVAARAKDEHALLEEVHRVAFPFRKAIEANAADAVEQMFCRWRDEIAQQRALGIMSEAEHANAHKEHFLAVYRDLQNLMDSPTHPDQVPKDASDVAIDKDNRSALWTLFRSACMNAHQATLAMRMPLSLIGKAEDASKVYMKASSSSRPAGSDDDSVEEGDEEEDGGLSIPAVMKIGQDVTRAVTRYEKKQVRKLVSGLPRAELQGMFAEGLKTHTELIRHQRRTEMFQRRARRQDAIRAREERVQAANAVRNSARQVLLGTASATGAGGGGGGGARPIEE